MWLSENCTTYILDKNIECKCTEITSTTVVNDIKGLFTGTNAKEIFSVKGINNL